MSTNRPTIVPRSTGLALDLNPGDDHYRAFVGPPQDYDLVSAMVFNLLTCIGLRQYHRVLDIGCGSLRAGRLLIPYLNPEHYIGVEPNRWLVEDGIANELGMDLVSIKRPKFIFQDSLVDFSTPLNVDYAVAQSIFSHCGSDLIEQWLSQASFHLKDDGVLLATFLTDTNDCDENGWIYPECVGYKPETMAHFATAVGLHFRVLDWAHPRQTWGLFAKKYYDTSLIDGGMISWNRFIANVVAGK